MSNEDERMLKISKRMWRMTKSSEQISGIIQLYTILHIYTMYVYLYNSIVLFRTNGVECLTIEA